MKEEALRAISHTVWRDRLRVLGRVALVITPLGAIFIAITMYYATGSHQEVEGTVTGLVGVATDEGNVLFAIVALDDGASVQARVPSNFALMKGYRAKTIRTTGWFGARRYSFAGYMKIKSKGGQQVNARNLR